MNLEGVCEKDIDCKYGFRCNGKCPWDKEKKCCKEDLRIGGHQDCTWHYNHDKGKAHNTAYLQKCCSESNKCSEFQGDCDKDSECEDGLVCGNMNCPTGTGWHIEYDCCWKSKRVFKYTR